MVSSLEAVAPAEVADASLARVYRVGHGANAPDDLHVPVDPEPKRCPPHRSMGAGTWQDSVVALQQVGGAAHPTRGRTMSDSAATTQAFEAMAAILYAGSSYDDVYATICSTALELIDACDHASLMLNRGNKSWTAAATDEVGRRIDELELELGEGPCLDAI